MGKVFFLIMFFTTEIFCFIFNQQESGYVLENMYSFPYQTKYLALGYVNNAIVETHSLAMLNPAIIHEVFYKEINFLYIPLVSAGNFALFNFTTDVRTQQIYLPLSLSIGNITSAEEEKINMFKESYGYKFKEILLFTNLSLSYYLRRYDINCGINLKTYFQSIDDYYATTINFDLGILTPTKKDYIWGISFLNIFPTKFGSETLCPIIRTSLNHKVGTIFFSEVKIYTEFDIINLYDIQKTTYRWGFGTSYDFFYLPISLSFSLSYYNIAMGFDIEKDNLNFSYALNYNQIGVNHLFALRYRFDFYPEQFKKYVNLEQEKLKVLKKEFIKEFNKEKEETKKIKKETELQQQILTKLLSAKRFIEEKNYIKAKEVVEEVLKLSPDNFYAKELLSSVNAYIDKSTILYLYGTAKDEYEKGNYDAAISKLNKLLEIDNTHTKAIVLLKFCYVQKFILEKKYNDAKIELFEILKLEPDNPSALELLKKVNTLIEISE